MALESDSEHPVPLGLVVSKLRQWIDRLGWVWVEAQLIEVSRRSGQTVFLTFRDRLANASANIRISAATLDAAGPITPGVTVVARLKASYYEPSGAFAFYCDAITPVGEGRLLAQLEQTKRLLQAEGLFDPARKRRLPFLPRLVGLITGSGSAAERDVVENARRRWPAVAVRPRYALVQGPTAAAQLIEAVRELDADPSVDVIVIARGGGSLEDLLPFSDEGLVRAVFACRTPVVAAIGHESDTPILDYVADVRASTPTDAAKRIVPDVADELSLIREARRRLDRAVDERLSREERTLRDLRSRPVLADPLASFAVHTERLAELRRRGRRAIGARLDTERSWVGHQLVRVRAMSPHATLERGYAIVTGASGHAVTSASAVEVGSSLAVRLIDGELAATVTDRKSVTAGRSGDGEG